MWYTYNVRREGIKMNIIKKLILSKINFYEVLEFYYSKMYDNEFHEYIKEFQKYLLTNK